VIPARPARLDRPTGPASPAQRKAIARRLVALAPPAALVALVAVSASFATDRAAAPARLFLALVAAAVLGAAGLAAGAHARWLPAAAALLAPCLLLVPVDSPLAPALVLGIAGVALAAATGERLRRPPWPRLAALAALGFAAQLLVHADALWRAPLEPGALALLAVAPVVAALSVAALGRARPGLGVAAALAAFAAGPGWSWAGCAALAAAALLVGATRPRPGLAAGAVALAAAVPALGDEPAWVVLALLTATALAADPRPRPAALGRGALAAAALGALLAGGLPWRREAPVASLLSTVGAPPRARLEAPLGPRTATLGAGSRRLELDWRVDGVAALVVDAFLSDAAELPCGTPVARFRLYSDGREVARARLAVGAGLGEWAALRPDVAARLACRAGAPFAHWLPRGGRFLGARWRARLPLPRPVTADRLVVEASRRLPRATRLALVAVGGER
jgi:hypothetical protein